ncbi:antibiotic biosynthesis monooxygenase [Streptomyces sp. NPDC047108]|uniref:antibiotic biosynthesis monooxygenase n=1 Tax=Streptomyces sp. NPDC047108 TaxID=3155025 RepID=UPI0033F9DAF7
MNRSASRTAREDGATVVTSQKVRPGFDDDYQSWQEKTNRVVQRFEGFEGTELYPPGAGAENEWTVVFRFSRLDQLTAWLDSGTRRELLDEERPLLEEEPRQEVLAGGAPAEETGVTAVISHEVPPRHEEDFERWQDKVLKAQQSFPGFKGSEMFRPVAGVQENWVVAFRYDTREHLDDWLNSGARKRLLDEGADYFRSYDVRKVGSAFSGWFRFEEGAEKGIPPNWKQAMTVVLALYPTVMVLNLTVGFELNDLGVPAWFGLFIGNICSVAILTWVLMPLVTRLFDRWLAPRGRPGIRVHVLGALVVVACYAVLLVIFGLTTAD